MAQGVDRPPVDRDLVEVEEADLREVAVDRLLDDLDRVRPLDLVAEVLRVLLGRHGAPAPLDLDVVVPGLGVVVEPVARGRGADGQELLVVEVKEDGVPDVLPVGVGDDELFGLPGFGVLEAVDREVGEQVEGVGALDLEVGHVIREVHQRAALGPRALLLDPVGELRGEVRELPHTEVAKQFDGTAGGLDSRL